MLINNFKKNNINYCYIMYVHAVSQYIFIITRKTILLAKILVFA